MFFIWKNEARGMSLPPRTPAISATHRSVRSKAGPVAGGGDHAGDVDQFAVAAVGAGGDGDVPAGPQEGGAGGQDLVKPAARVSSAVVGEVAAVAAVAVVDFADLAGAGAGGADVAVGGRPRTAGT